MFSAEVNCLGREPTMITNFIYLAYGKVARALLRSSALLLYSSCALLLCETESKADRNRKWQ